MNKHFYQYVCLRLLSALALMMLAGTYVNAHSVFTESLEEGQSCFFSSFGNEDSSPEDLVTCDDCCDSGDKVISFTMIYNGANCGSSNTCQQSGKWSCSDSGGGPNGDTEVYIIMSENDNGGDVYFSGNVALNGSFTAAAANAGQDKFPSNTYFRIFNSQGGSLRQLVKVHASCSAPVVIGDQFGSLILTGATFKNGVSCNNAPPPPDEVCPNPVITVPPSQVCAGAPVVFSAPDLGFPCLIYAWDFGSTASPQVAFGKGPHTITFSTSGSKTVKLTIDNGCDGDNGNGSGGSGSGGSGSGGSGSGGSGSGGSGSGGSGSGGSGSGGSGSGGSGSSGGPLLICPCDNGGSGSGGSGSGGSGSGGSGSGGSGSSGSGSGSSGDPCGGSGSGGSGSGGSGSGGSGSGGSGSGGSGSGGSGSGSGGSGSGSSGNGSGNCLECRKTVTVTIQVDNCGGGGLGKIGDFVWSDLNGNGTQDASEPGIGNAFVMLKKCDGAFVKFVFTDANGMYMFNDLPAGCYRVFFANPNGSIYMPTGANTGGNDSVDSDAGVDGNTGDINLLAGQTNLTVDAGFKPIGAPQLGSIGDRVFNDANQNGVQDASEVGVPNVTVQLKNCSNTVLSTTTTNGAGNYNFGSLQGGCYRIGIVLPAGFQISPQNVGNDAADSDINPANLMTGDINLAAGQNDPTNDAGIYQQAPQLGSIGDRVFNDANQNGIQDASEVGVPNVTVQLKNCSNTVLSTTTTNGSGNYSFGNLQAGCYRIGIVLPAGFQVSPQNVGNDALDSDINPSNLMTGNINLAAGQNDPTNDAGIYQPTTNPCDPISITVAPGQISVSGANAPIVTIQVFNSAWATVFSCGGIGPVCTSPQAIPLQAGNYCVSVKLYTANWQLICDKYDCYTVPPGGGNPGSIGDKVFKDLDQDGIQDPGEPGVPNVTVQLKNCSNSVLQTTTTNANGIYSFTNLSAGCYRVGVVLPTGFTFSPPNIGNDIADSDIIPSTAMTGDINLASGENNVTVDAGLVAQQGQCDNLNFGGQVGFGATCAGTFEICNAGGAAGPIIGNCSPPSGGSGAMEIIWLRNRQNCDPIAVTIDQLLNDPSSSPWEIVPGANGLTLNPGFVSTTTCFQRCARRAGCTQYLGESNMVQIIVNPNCGGTGGPGNCANISITTSPGKITVRVDLNGSPVTSLQIFSANWSSTLYSCFGNCSATQQVNLPAGTYRVLAKYFTAGWVPICEVLQTVSISSQLLADHNFEFEAMKNEEHVELVWLHNVGEVVETYTLERSLDGVDFEEISNHQSLGGTRTEVYEGFDMAPAYGDNYYRIRMHLVNGEVDYSDTRKVNYADLLDLMIFPNPANEFVKANLEDIIGYEDVTITLYNNLGLVVKQFKLDEVTSKYYQMDIRDVHEGHYIVWFEIPGRRAMAKQLVVGKI